MMDHTSPSITESQSSKPVDRARVMRGLTSPISTRGPRADADKDDQKISMSLPANFYRNYKPPPTPVIRPRLDQPFGEPPSLDLPPSYKEQSAMPSAQAMPTGARYTRAPKGFGMAFSLPTGSEMARRMEQMGSSSFSRSLAVMRKHGSREDVREDVREEESSGLAEVKSDSIPMTESASTWPPAGSLTLLSLIGDVKKLDIAEEPGSTKSGFALPNIPLIPLDADEQMSSTQPDGSADAEEDDDDDMFPMDDI